MISMDATAEASQHQGRRRQQKAQRHKKGDSHAFVPFVSFGSQFLMY
jgi:hypothetical protein